MWQLQVKVWTSSETLWWIEGGNGIETCWAIWVRQGRQANKTIVGRQNGRIGERIITIKE